MTLKRKTETITVGAGQEKSVAILEGSDLFKRRVVRLLTQAREAGVSLLAKLNQELFIDSPTVNLWADDNGLKWEVELKAGDRLTMGLRNGTDAVITRTLTVEYDEERTK